MDRYHPPPVVLKDGLEKGQSRAPASCAEATASAPAGTPANVMHSAVRNMPMIVTELEIRCHLVFSRVRSLIRSATVRPPRSGPCWRPHRPIFGGNLPMCIRAKIANPMWAIRSVSTSGQPQTHMSDGPGVEDVSKRGNCLRSTNVDCDGPAQPCGTTVQRCVRSSSSCALGRSLRRSLHCHCKHPCVDGGEIGPGLRRPIPPPARMVQEARVTPLRCPSMNRIA